MMRDYVWLNIHPGTRKLRDGSVVKNARETKQWEIAYNNHRRVAHRGTESDSCPACKEIRQKLHESMEK